MLALRFVFFGGKTMKAFDLAMFCGRFQHVHIGHEYIINTALKIADRQTVQEGLNVSHSEID